MTTPQDPQGQPPPVPPPAPPLTYPGSMPTPVGGPAPAPSEAAARPKEVAVSFWLWVVNFLIGLIVVAIILGQYDTIRDIVLQGAREAAQRQGGTIDERQLDAITTTVIVIFVIVFLVVSAAQLLFALFMRKGRNWARIVLAVIGGLLLLVELMSLVGASGRELGLTVLSVVVLAGAIITMFLPGANPWFRSRPRGLTSG